MRRIGRALKRAWKATKKVFKSLFSGGVYYFIKGVDWLCRLFHSGNRRELKQSEKNILKLVFDDALEISKIRIHPGFSCIDAIPQLSREAKRMLKRLLKMSSSDPHKQAFVIGYVIYVRGIDFDQDPHALVHEAVHVWQFERVGADYMTEAVWAQLTVPDAYNWKRELRRGKTSWTEFNREAQAEMIADIYTDGVLVEISTGNVIDSSFGSFYRADNVKSRGRLTYSEDGTVRDFSPLAEAAVVALRLPRSFGGLS